MSILRALSAFVVGKQVLSWNIESLFVEPVYDLDGLVRAHLLEVAVRVEDVESRAMLLEGAPDFLVLQLIDLSRGSLKHSRVMHHALVLYLHSEIAQTSLIICNLNFKKI